MIRSVVCALIAAVVFLPWPSAAQDSTAAPRPVTRIDNVVGMVGNEPILRSEVHEARVRLMSEGHPPPADSIADRKLMRELLDSIVDARLLTIAAMDAGVEVDEEQIAAQVDADITQIRRQPGLSNDSTFRRALRQAGFASPEAFRSARLEGIRGQARRSKYLQQLRQDGKLAPATVTEAEIQELWNTTKPQLGKRIGGYTFKQIVIPVQPKPEAKLATHARADSLLREILKASEPEQQLAKFIEIAKKESMDGSRDVGGDLGFQRRGALVPEFERWAFLLSVNSISPVFETIYGYHILRVDRARSSEVSVRHILLTPPTDSTDLETTRALGDSVAALLRGGAPFDSLANRYHDANELRVYPNPQPADSLVEEYGAAVRGLKPGDVAKPFVYPNPQGLPRVRVLVVTGFEEERDYTLDDARPRLREELIYRKTIRRLLDQLRKEYYVAVRY